MPASRPTAGRAEQKASRSNPHRSRCNRPSRSTPPPLASGGRPEVLYIGAEFNRLG